MQNQNVQTVDLLGGWETQLPQLPAHASEVENFTIDRVTGGWSSRVGYEPYKLGNTNWEPFQTDGPIYALHAAQGLAGGARQSILYETGGELRLVYEAAGNILVRVLATGRNIPAASEAGSWFTDTTYGTVVTNGVDRPVIVRPWPLGSAADSASTITQCIRPFGFDSVPPPPEPGLVKPVPAGKVPDTSGNGATSLWTPYRGTAIPAGGKWGLGFPLASSDTLEGPTSTFGWGVSYISDTGSEGPISPLGVSSWILPADADGLRHIVPVSIPVGGAGIIARKVYRTTNYSDDYQYPGDTTLYFIEVIRNNVEDLYFDAVPTATLGQPAPTFATGPLPAPNARFSALFQGCLFLDGGINDSRTIYFSAPGLIEQFGAANYIEMSGNGGGITGLYTHYNALLIFRERGIDVVQGDFSTGFQATALSDSVSCKSPHSIATIPGLGVVFLGDDGVYAITGGFQGGALAEVIKLTSGLEDFIRTLTPDCLPRAVGCFSNAWREYHVYVPTQGNDRPNRGLVLHVDRLLRTPDLSAWSLRRQFPVGAVTTLYDGTIVFGHHTGNENNPQDGDAPRGLFVISGKRARGKVYVDDTLVWNDPPTSVYRSAWQSFGDPQLQKQVHYVTLWVYTTGETAITIKHYKDFSLTAVAERTYKMQPPDAASLPVFDKAVFGVGNYTTERLVPVRFSIAHQSAAWFCWEVETTEDVILVGCQYSWQTKGALTVPGVRV